MSKHNIPEQELVHHFGQAFFPALILGAGALRLDYPLTLHNNPHTLSTALKRVYRTESFPSVFRDRIFFEDHPGQHSSCPFLTEVFRHGMSMGWLELPGPDYLEYVITLPIADAVDRLNSISYLTLDQIEEWGKQFLIKFESLETEHADIVGH